MKKLVRICSFLLVGGQLFTSFRVLAQEIPEIDTQVDIQTMESFTIQEKEMVSEQVEETQEKNEEPAITNSSESGEDIKKEEDLTENSSSGLEPSEGEITSSTSEEPALVEEFTEMSEDTKKNTNKTPEAQEMIEDTKESSQRSLFPGYWVTRISNNVIELIEYAASTSGVFQEVIVPTLQDFKSHNPSYYANCTAVKVTVNALKTGAKNTLSFSISKNGDKVICSGNPTNVFRNYTTLQSIDLTNLDVSNVTDMTNMFNGCSNLTSLVGIDNWDTSNVKYMSALFNGCNSLKSLDLSNWDTSNVKNMDNMFAAMKSLTSFNIENLNTSSVTNMANMFTSFQSNVPLDLSHFDTSNVTNMSGMFRLNSLSKLDLSSFDTSKVTDMSEMFKWSQFTKLDLSNFDTSKVTKRSSMFFSESIKPLCVITKDKKLLSNYSYSSDKRVPCGPTFSPNGGQFSSSNTANKAYFEKEAMTLEEYTNKASISNLKKYAKDNQPTRDGYVFQDWLNEDGQSIDSLTDSTDFDTLLDQTYAAQWINPLNPNAPSGSVKPGSESMDCLNFMYIPEKFIVPETELQDSGEQKILLNNGQELHIGIKDQNSNNNWSLYAQLIWDNPGLENIYIQTKNVTGQVNKNNNDGKTEFADTDLQSTSDVTGEKEVKISSEAQTLIMSANNGQRIGVYDYNLESSELVLPESKYIQPNNYTGSVNWNLVNAP